MSNLSRAAVVSLLVFGLLIEVFPATAQTWFEITPPADPNAPFPLMGGGYDPVNNRLIAFYGISTGTEVWVLTSAIHPPGKWC